MYAQVQCSHCRRPFQVPPANLGQKVRCSYCNGTFVAQAAPPPEEPLTVLAADEAHPARPWYVWLALPLILPIPILAISFQILVRGQLGLVFWSFIGFWLAVGCAGIALWGRWQPLTRTLSAVGLVLGSYGLFFICLLVNWLMILLWPPPPTAIAANKLPGLIAYWNFDEGSGERAKDSSGNELHGNLIGAGWTKGVKGTALEFSMPGDCFDYGSSPKFNFAPEAAFTYACWIKTLQDEATILSQRNRTDGSPVIDITIESSHPQGLVRQDANELGDHASVRGRNRINDGDWHHLALTRTGSTVELFIDGVSQGRSTSANAGGAVTTNWRTLGLERFWLKDGPGNSRCYLNGAMDEVCIFDRALSPTEIRRLAGKQ